VEAGTRAPERARRTAECWKRLTAGLIGEARSLSTWTEHCTDPAEGIVGCFRLALETLGRNAPPAAELHWIIGPSLRRSFADALNGEGDPEEALKIYLADGIRSKVFSKATVYDGVQETLAELRAAGTRLFLCTAKPLCLR